MFFHPLFFLENKGEKVVYIVNKHVIYLFIIIFYFYIYI